MAYIGNPVISQAFVTDYFSGNGSTVAFTMSVAPASSSSIEVVVGGVPQYPNTYSVSGTTLTFSGAPPSGTGNIFIRYLGIPAITQAIANKFPFYVSSGASSPIQLLSNQYFPFYTSNGASNNITLIVV